MNHTRNQDEVKIIWFCTCIYVGGVESGFRKRVGLMDLGQCRIIFLLGFSLINFRLVSLIYVKIN